MASMNVKLLEEFRFHSNVQQFSKTNMSVGVGVFEACDLCCQVVNCALNITCEAR
jgi:hypothetical protein